LVLLPHFEELRDPQRLQRLGGVGLGVGARHGARGGEAPAVRHQPVVVQRLQPGSGASAKTPGKMGKKTMSSWKKPAKKVEQ